MGFIVKSQSIASDLVFYQYHITRTEGEEVLRKHRTIKTKYSDSQGKDIKKQDRHTCIRVTGEEITT